MRFEIVHKPWHSMLRAYLDSDDCLRAESGTLVAMTPNIEIESGYVGGIKKAITRFLKGEGAVLTIFKATRGSGEVLLAPSVFGDITALELRGDAFMIGSGAMLAASGEIMLHRRTPAKGFLHGDNHFMMRISGYGTVFVSSVGGLEPIELIAGQNYLVDTAHVAAFSDTMDFKVKKVSKKFLGVITPGEGVIAEFVGPGVIYIQSRSPHAVAAFTEGFLSNDK